MAVGLYIERKGILEFLELARRMPEYKFIWFGYTKPSLIPENISRAIKNRPSNVQFPGYVESGELKDAYAGCDLYIFPTKEETEGIVLLEALALKTKTLISDIPIFDDWLKDGVDVYKAVDVDDFEKKGTLGASEEEVRDGLRKALNLDCEMVIAIGEAATKFKSIVFEL